MTAAMIDLPCMQAAGFAVINVIGPALSGSQSDHGRRHSYELKVARRVVQKYSGTMATEPRGELFAVKDRAAAHQGMKEKNTACFLCKMYKERAAFFVLQKPNIPPEIPLFANLLPEI